MSPSHDNIIMSEPMSSGSCTRVFWDLVDYPVPNGLDPDFIYQKMKSILESMGFLGEVSIMAYVDKENLRDEWLYDAYKKARINIVVVPQQGDDYARVHSMVLDIALWALENPANYFEPLNLMVISKNIKEGTDFLKALEALEDRYYNVLLALPHDLSSSRNLHTVSFEWLSTSLLDGANPVDQSITLQHKPNSRDDIVGFSDGLASLDLQNFDEFQIVVFWDVQGCPIDFSTFSPVFLSKGYCDVLIRPYIDMDYGDVFVNYGDYWCEPIVVTEVGKYAKDTRMLLDIVFWAMNNDDVPQNLMLISKPKDTKCNSVIQALEHRGFNVIFRHSAEYAEISTILSFEQLCETKVTIQMQSLKFQGRKIREESEEFAFGPVVVFWLVEDCPSNPSKIWSNVRSTLSKKGYRDIMSMTAYGYECKFSKEMVSVYHKAGVQVKLVKEEKEKIAMLSMDLIDSSAKYYMRPVNFLVISKPFKDPMCEYCVLEILKPRGVNVLFELPDYMFTFGSSLWSAKSLLD